MTAQELLEHFDPSAPQPVYLLCPHKAPRAKSASFEPLLAERAVKHIVNSLVDPSMRDLAFNAYYADETDPAEVVSVAETLPFLTDYRVILVRNAERYDNDGAASRLIPYIQSPSPTSVVMFVATQIDQRKKLYKAFDKAGFVVPTPQLQDHQVRLWINQEVQARGKAIDPDAVNQLVERSGTHLADVENALQLITGYVGDQPVIHEEDVRAACADVAEDEVWSLTDAIAESDTAKAVHVLHKLLDLGKSEFEILGSINWLLKTAYDVASARPNDPKLRGFAAKKCRPLAEKFGVQKLRDAFTLMVETDFMLRSTGTDRSLALELLVIKLAAPRGGKRSSAA